jgi:hypothetical protein
MRDVARNLVHAELEVDHDELNLSFRPGYRVTSEALLRHMSREVSSSHVENSFW